MHWSEKTPVILYGAGYMGTLFKNYLCTFCNIIAFLDRRADEIPEHHGLPVYLPEIMPFDLETKRSTIVIVSVKNVFDHSKIAQKLLAQGFPYILTFKHRLFDEIVNETLMLPNGIDLYHSDFRFQWRDAAFLQKQDGRVTVLIPAPLVFTNRGSDRNIDRWSDWPIYSLFPHLDLFSLYNGMAETNVSSYVDEYCIDGAKKLGNINTSVRWKQNILESRQKVFFNMEREWQLKTGFFKDNAPTAEFHNGRFNLTSGKHRAAFLVSKNEFFLPLSISQDDYACFLNLDKAQVVMNYFESLGQEETFLSVMHPYFYDYSCCSGFALYLIIQQLLLYIGRNILFYGKKICDINIFSRTEKYASIARYFMQIGCTVDNSESITPLDCLLDELCYCVIEEKSQCQHYDVAIIEMKDCKYNDISVDSDSYLLLIEDASDVEALFSPSSFRSSKLHRFFYEDRTYWAVFIVKVK